MPLHVQIDWYGSFFLNNNFLPKLILSLVASRLSQKETHDRTTIKMQGT